MNKWNEVSKYAWETETIDFLIKFNVEEDTMPLLKKPLIFNIKEEITTNFLLDILLRIGTYKSCAAH